MSQLQSTDCNLSCRRWPPFEMSTACQPLIVYLELARAAELRRRPYERDRLLVLAAVAACRAGQTEVAEFCRHKVLANNPGHVLANYEDVVAALADERFDEVFKRHERAFPLERAEHMLRSLGIEMPAAGVAYHNETEHAAALLGTTRDALDHWYVQQAAPARDAAKPFPGDATARTRPARWQGCSAIGTHRRLWLWLCGLFVLVGLFVLMVLVVRH